jgi:hypothetical protein
MYSAPGNPDFVVQMSATKQGSSPPPPPPPSATYVLDAVGGYVLDVNGGKLVAM